MNPKAGVLGDRVATAAIAASTTAAGSFPGGFITFVGRTAQWMGLMDLGLVQRDSEQCPGRVPLRGGQTRRRCFHGLGYLVGRKERERTTERSIFKAFAEVRSLF